METSDDEMEDLPKSVTNYYFVDDAEEPISFSTLPINWNTSEVTQGSGKQIYVRGNADGGLDKIFKPVRAWKFDISRVKPEISVLSKDNSWIKLQKPRQSYEEYIRTVLITVNFLHVVKRNPDVPGKRIWKKLSDIFGLYEVIPSTKDLASHRALIEQAVQRDESLKKSKCLLTVLERNPHKKHTTEEDVLVREKSGFVVNDEDCSSDELEDDSGDDEANGSGDEDSLADEEDDEEPFDSVCSICDEGGPLLCCEGSCMRSFHATTRAGKPSKCLSLGFTEKEVQDMPYFKCENCEYKIHQCYSCGQLGSSDKQTGAKVFQCVNATCGYFYHPHCVARRLLGNNEDSSKELAEKIQAGESFTCPLHVCVVCKQAEDKTHPELQMAVCRRCPKAYHKKCLPKKIRFEDDEDEGFVQRAWEGLLVDRILIYCLKHEILEDLGTPARDHIKFPHGIKKEKESSAGILKGKLMLKKKMPSLKTPSQAPLVLESKKKNVEGSDPDKKNDRRVTKLQKKLPSEKKSVLTKIDGPSGVEEGKCIQKLDLIKTSQNELSGEFESTKTSKAAVKKFVPQLDSDSERRILELMNEASSIITLDDIIEKHGKLISSRAYKQKSDPCKSITLGKVERFCEAVPVAIKKLDGGGSIEDAKNICGPAILNQMVKWKGKLKVYLAPFIYGMRYTSFGRHFTKVEKLKEIVDTLHWYVNNDDTIVDFCCGANDFSMLMKEKLESRGKKCNYKNYDLFHPKNDFCFEARDWMDVQPSELPNGSKLIMGINPPFGVKACKANQFINKALQFKPKLLILIVPPETQRLDKKKKTSYDLVWEYKDKLSGKSFYLPGSVDTNDKQMEDWNIVAPNLYLWSRPDWTSKHMAVAKKHNHLLGEQRQNQPTNRLDRDSSFKKSGQSCTTKEIEGASTQNDPPESLKKRAVVGNENPGKQSTHKDHSIGKQANAASGSSKKKKNSKKKRHNEGMHAAAGGGGESFQPFKRRRSSPDKPLHEVSCHSPLSSRDGREPHNARHHVGSPTPYAERRYSVENRTSRYQESPPNLEIGHPPRDHHSLAATGYDETGNYGSHYYRNWTANFHPRSDIYSREREKWPEASGAIVDYRPLQNPAESSPGYMRPGHGFGINQSAYDGRVNHNSMSAMDKYRFTLNEPNSVRLGGSGYGPAAYVPDMAHSPGAVLYNHRQAQAQVQGYPGVPMDFAPGPPNHYHHPTPSGGWINE